MLDGRVDAAYADVAGRSIVFDYSADGIRRSLEASLERLGVDRIDVALIHDPDDHWEAAIGEAFPALARLREEGVIRAIGAGMNQSAMLARFAREGDFDVFLLAGRYTLLDQDALDELLPLCVERRIAVMIGGVMNSGILADPRPGGRFNYQAAPAAIVDRAQRLAAACARHGVPLKAAAVQFPLAHPAVASRRRRASGRSRTSTSTRALLAEPIPADALGRAPRRGPPARRRADAVVSRRRARHTIRVDAHHHFWPDPRPADYPWMTDELAAIRRPFTPDDLAAAARRGRDRRGPSSSRRARASTRRRRSSRRRRRRRSSPASSAGST